MRASSGDWAACPVARPDPPGTPGRRRGAARGTRRGASRGAAQHPPSQQIDRRAPEHLALHELQPRDLPLGLSI